ncbi:hypothetical protein E0H75_18760 [Kribbella capetownensis]|uniref:Uncharacterized protein n=1 Tax=Kribbella capetownensis TaxID=1572659 RepID=A0A4R0JN31_9ACTN|nr:hypothetical protein [Kribbella capetownensis]TCC48631.1 hypothetical protein E0H75_18760 [Kribbella capetownensis]
MQDLDDERAYAERCREALRRMVAGARENVVIGEDTWGDRYTAERLGFYLKTLARGRGARVTRGSAPRGWHRDDRAGR